jgi:hypothetical protein
LHHVDESWLELESIDSYIGFWYNTNVGGGWSREFAESPISLASNSGVKLHFIWLSSDSKAKTFLSLALVLLINLLDLQRSLSEG